jgi:short-subunit dehydrogenase
MAARGEGTLVVVASVASFTAAPGLADYSASKAAVATFFETLRVELAPSGVNVVTVYPGPVKTAMEAAARAKVQPGLIMRSLPSGTPEELGTLVRAAVRGGDERVIYPKFYQTSRQFPRLAQWLTNRFTPPISS